MGYEARAATASRRLAPSRPGRRLKKRMIYLPPRRKGRLDLVIVAAILGLFLVLAFIAGPILMDKFFLGDETGSIGSERLRPVR